MEEKQAEVEDVLEFLLPLINGSSSSSEGVEVEDLVPVSVASY